MSKAEIRKAAVLLMSLPQAEAARLMSGLDPRQLDAVAAEIASVESVTADEQTSVMRELAEVNVPAAGRRRGGSGTYGAPHLPGEIGAAGARSLPPTGPFAFLKDVDGQTLLGFLVDERPQTIALIASHVPSAYGAELISGLPPERQLAVIRSVASMEPTDPTVVRDVALALEQRLRALVG